MTAKKQQSPVDQVNLVPVISRKQFLQLSVARPATVTPRFVQVLVQPRKVG